MKAAVEAEVAPLLGLAPNAVAALAYRAREGLRQAYLQAHLHDQQAAECRDCAASLGAYVRDGLSARDRRRVDAHLDGCSSCKGLVAELAECCTRRRQRFPRSRTHYLAFDSDDSRSARNWSTRRGRGPGLAAAGGTGWAGPALRQGAFALPGTVGGGLLVRAMPRGPSLLGV